MKKILQPILKPLGLLPLAQRYERRLRMQKKYKALKPYAEINEWKMEYGPLSLRFSTKALYPKGWFYPRYDHGNIHEPIATDVFIEHIRPTDQVVDIGGHLGYFSCVSGALASEGSVNVFEVDPKCIGYIQENAALNQLDHVKVHNHAVSNKREVISIPSLETPNPGLVIQKGSGKHFIKVESIVLDDYLKEINVDPDFIKIDVEGAEWLVLQGMNDILNKGKATVLVEIHVKKLQKFFDTDYHDILAYLSDHGYQMEEIDHRNTAGGAVLLDRDATLTGNTMLLCKKA
jgi:FkbM family methyltransferase